MTLKEDIQLNGVPRATYAIRCAQNSRYLGAGAAIGSRINAIYSHKDPLTHFQFREFDHGTIGLFNLYHNSFCTLVGHVEPTGKYHAWHLVCGGADRQWGEFSLDRNAKDGDNDFWFRSTHPVAVQYPYLQVVSADRWLGVIKDRSVYTSDPLWQKLIAEEV